MFQPFFGGVALLLTFALFVPYIRSIKSGQTKPHVFSWVIWALGTFVVALAQLADGGGLGAWVIAVSGLITGYIAWLSWAMRADISISRADWFFLVAALSALPLWFFTQDPLWAVAILTTSDLLGFGPTIRKAFHKPREEPMGFYALGALRNGFVLLALENHTLTTMLFPALVGAACLALSALIFWRRHTETL